MLRHASFLDDNDNDNDNDDDIHHFRMTASFLSYSLLLSLILTLVYSILLSYSLSLLVGPESIESSRV